MNYQRNARIAFASGLISLGVFGLLNGDFADLWLSVRGSFPGRSVFAYGSSALVLACGIGLLFKRTEVTAARVLVALLTILVLFLKLPAVVRGPLVEASWQSLAEMIVPLAAALVLVAADERARRTAQVMFGLALIPLGLAHFAYLRLTAPLIPHWIPFHTALAYFTGAAHIAAALGVLFGIYARVAATLEGAMLSAFTVLVWIPMIVATPASRASWSELALSWAVSAAAFVVAASISKGASRTADGTGTNGTNTA